MNLDRAALLDMAQAAPGCVLGQSVWHSRPRLCPETDIVGCVSTRRDTRDGDVPPTRWQQHSRGRLCHM